MWLYDGLPDGLGLRVPDATSMEGGYLVVLELGNGEIRLLGTRYPAKYMTTWKSRSRQCAGSELKRVMVSNAHPLYERLKRLLQGRMDEQASELKANGMDHIRVMAEPIFKGSASTTVARKEVASVPQVHQPQTAARATWVVTS